MIRLILVLVGCCLFIPATYCQSITPISGNLATPKTADKPQSKTWQYQSHWYTALPTSTGINVWRTDGVSWEPELAITGNEPESLDVLSVGENCYMVAKHHDSFLVHFSEYDLASGRYISTGALSPSGLSNLGYIESITMDIDSNDRLWVSYDTSNTIEVSYSDYPYQNWSTPQILTSDIASDDISVIFRLPGNKIGVMWSDQNNGQFGFRIRSDSDSPNVWSPDEMPGAGGSSVGLGIADDHINIAVASSGHVYAIVKTGYDTVGYPKIGLLERDINGSWSSLYGISQNGTRPIILLDEGNKKLFAIYTSKEGQGQILWRESSSENIDFGQAYVLLDGSLNDPSSSKSPSGDSFLVVASNNSATYGALFKNQIPPSNDLVGYWTIDDFNNLPTISDSSGFGNNGVVQGDYESGLDCILGDCLLFGRDAYITVPSSPSLDITDEISIIAWVRPSSVETQYLVKKGNIGSTAKYELSLSAYGYAFVRFNDKNSLRLNAISLYPSNDETWMHLAATYDGSKIKIYVNGQLEREKSATFVIGTNTKPLCIGAQSNGARTYEGTIDEVYLYRKSLTADEIEMLYQIGR